MDNYDELILRIECLEEIIESNSHKIELLTSRINVLDEINKMLSGDRPIKEKIVKLNPVVEDEKRKTFQDKVEILYKDLGYDSNIKLWNEIYNNFNEVRGVNMWSWKDDTRESSHIRAVEAKGLLDKFLEIGNEFLEKKIND